MFLLGVCDGPFICCHRGEGASAATEVCCSDESCDGDFPTAPDNEVISLFSRKGTPLRPGGRRLFLFYLVSEAIFLLHSGVDRR